MFDRQNGSANPMQFKVFYIIKKESHFICVYNLPLFFLFLYSGFMLTDEIQPKMTLRNITEGI